MDVVVIKVYRPLKTYIVERFWAAPVVTLTQTVFISTILFLTLVLRIEWRPDNLALVLAFLFFVTGRGSQFVRDWTPFLLVLLSYDALRGFADNLNTRVVTWEIAALERALFGTIPTVELQRLWVNIGEPKGLAVLAIVLYSAHFFIPVMVGLWLWLSRRDYFRPFTASIMILSYAGFITFLIMPVMPPWMAMDQGFIPAERLSVFRAEEPTGIYALPTIYRLIGPNPVAAFPSLHAAYPWLAFLWMRRLMGWRAMPMAGYSLAVWTALVFLADHYVVDILGGLAYTHIVYFFVARRVKNQ
ncbi:MAG: hypothetical protein HW403_304 [Dehalococcoidia bacterium]|nr:hypothetical protein [Dehalococcoidia bacterium]